MIGKKMVPRLPKPRGKSGTGERGGGVRGGAVRRIIHTSSSRLLCISSIEYKYDARGCEHDGDDERTEDDKSI